MDAVRSDQNIALRGEPFTRRGNKVGFDLTVRFVPGQKGAIDMNATGGSYFDSLVEQALQPATMDRDLRIRQACAPSARVVPHGKSPIRAIEEMVWCNACPFQHRKHIELIERCGGMGHQVDAHTQFLNRRRLLEHLAVDAVLVQEKRGGQSANTRTYNDRLHFSPSSDSTQPKQEIAREIFQVHFGWVTFVTNRLLL